MILGQTVFEIIREADFVSNELTNEQDEAHSNSAKRLIKIIIRPTDKLTAVNETRVNQRRLEF